MHKNDFSPSRVREKKAHDISDGDPLLPRANTKACKTNDIVYNVNKCVCVYT